MSNAEQSFSYEDPPERKHRSPGMKLLFALLVAGALAVPLMMVYALVWDRQDQSRNAHQTITQGWGGAQLITGPVLVIPYTQTITENSVVDGKQTSKLSNVTRELYLSPVEQAVATALEPQVRQKSIYASVLYNEAVTGTARFAMPEDLERQGIDPASLMPARAELRFGVSDPRGLQSDSKVTANGEVLATRPGGGPLATGGAGFHGFPDWDGSAPLNVGWSYGLRVSETISLVPRGRIPAFRAGFCRAIPPSQTMGSMRASQFPTSRWGRGWR